MIQHNDQPTRFERLAAIRRQIAAGVYETPDKLEAAVEAFLASGDAHPPTHPPTRPGRLGERS